MDSVLAGLVYSLYASNFHRPSCFISLLGSPILLAVVAVPRLSEDFMPRFLISDSSRVGRDSLAKGPAMV